jgi:hypothetical protein
MEYNLETIGFLILEYFHFKMKNIEKNYLTINTGVLDLCTT